MSTVTRRTLIGAALLTGLAACTPDDGAPGSSAIPSPSSPAPASKLTVGLTYVPDIQFAPLYVAHHFGWFTEEGLDVTLRHHGAQEKLLGALQTGDEDVVFAGGGEMLQGRSQQIPVRSFATVYQQYPVALIVPADSAIQSFADLKGHTIGLPGQYGENWFFLLAALAEAGLTPADVDIKSIGYTQYAGLTEAQVDSVVGFLNNDVVRFAEGGFAIRTLTLADPPLVSVGFGALDVTVDARPEDLRAMVRAAARGAQLCVSDPEQAVQIAVAYVPTLTGPEQQSHALAVLKATTKLFGDQFGSQDRLRWEAMAAFFVEHELVSSPVPAREAFTADITG